VDVQKDAARLREMLGLAGGRRVVPVIVDEADGDRVTIGFGGT
jgi:hypothetical protein